VGAHSTLGGLACAILILTACGGGGGGGGGGGIVVSNDSLHPVRDTVFQTGSELACDDNGRIKVQGVSSFNLNNQQCMSAGLIDTLARSAHAAGHKG
jgi:hypothetical protein